MIRRFASLVCASLAVLCMGADVKSVSAQNYGYPTTNRVVTVPDTFVGNGYVTNGMGGYGGCGTCGTTVPPSYAYGAYSDYGCCNSGYVGGRGCNFGHGLHGWYRRSFGGSYCGYGGYGGDGCWGGYSYTNYGYGFSGCGHRRHCGYRSSYRACCTTLVPVVTPSCCAPLATCCGTCTSSAMIIQPGSVVSTPSNVSMAPLSTTTNPPAPPTEPAKPAAVAAPAPAPEPAPTAPAPAPEPEPAKAPEAPKPDA